jgi:hypothetical protein
MTVKELIAKLKEFPEDMEILNERYSDVDYIEKEVYPFIPTNAPKSMSEKKYVVIK